MVDQLGVEGYHVRRLMRDARVSKFEEHAFLVGFLLVVAGVVLAMVEGDIGGTARLLGLIGLGAFAVCALSRGVRLYLVGVAASLPRTVGRVGVRVRAGRPSTVITAFFALVAPGAATVALIVLVSWGWLAIAGALLIGCLALLMRALRGRPADPPYPEAPPEVCARLERLCMRADVPVPRLVVEPGPEANAWTTRGCIHVTKPILLLLDRAEVEAVLAHELAHLAHRDAAAMDICSAPSRVLLGYAGVLASGVKLWLKHLFEFPFPGVALWGAILAVISVPPAFVLGWLSRLSVLTMSRTREFAADAAAAALTGRPSALASALMKLDRESGWIPDGDLRRARARAVLCILGTEHSRLGPWFSTHPPTATRVARLEAIEERVQAGGRAIRVEE